MEKIINKDLSQNTHGKLFRNKIKSSGDVFGYGLKNIDRNRYIVEVFLCKSVGLTLHQLALKRTARPKSQEKARYSLTAVVQARFEVL